MLNQEIEEHVQKKRKRNVPENSIDVGLSAAPPNPMSCLSWNCRGLGNPRTIRDLYHLVNDKSPTLLFLIETKAKKERMHAMHCKMGFEGLFTVDPMGKSGGLALFWRDSKEVEILQYSLSHINASISMPRRNYRWLLTCFYGHPDQGHRAELWNLLTFIGSSNLSQWLCLGDFNKISNWSDKKGGAVRNEA